jgi:hypothetical protein
MEAKEQREKEAAERKKWKGWGGPLVARLRAKDAMKRISEAQKAQEQTFFKRLEEIDSMSAEMVARVNRGMGTVESLKVMGAIDRKMKELADILTREAGEDERKGAVVAEYWKTKSEIDKETQSKIDEVIGAMRMFGESEEACEAKRQEFMAAWQNPEEGEGPEQAGSGI